MRMYTKKTLGCSERAPLTNPCRSQGKKSWGCSKLLTPCFFASYVNVGIVQLCEGYRNLLGNVFVVVVDRSTRGRLKLKRYLFRLKSKMKFVCFCSATMYSMDP